MRLTRCLHCGCTLSRGCLCWHCKRELTGLAIWAGVLLFNLVLLVLVAGALR